MMSFICFFVGYRVYEFEKSDITALAKLLISANFSVDFKGEKCEIPLYKCRKFEKIIHGKVNFKVSKPKGVLGFLFNNRKNYAAIIALSLVAFLWYFSSLFVWDIRISGNKNTESDIIQEELSLVGFSVGTMWNKTDLSRVELSLLNSSKNVAWININRVGNVAYVRVVDKYTYDNDKKEGYSNIIAMQSGIIEEISVTRGRAVVKVGDSVKKGDLLISGILSDGTFTYAEGQVLARVSDSISISTPNDVLEKEYSQEFLDRISLKILNKEINIFKIYRNLQESYDIIENENRIYAFGKELPFAIVNYKYLPFEYVNYTRSETEVAEICKKDFNDMLLQRLSQGTLLKIKTKEGYTDKGYNITADLLISENIAGELPFGYEENR